LTHGRRENVDTSYRAALAGSSDARTAWRPRVGERVRVCLPRARSCPECPHFDGESGLTGRIIGVRPTISAPSHPYLVILDQPSPALYLSRLSIEIAARHYAADEVEFVA
jgi:hypothetical protein